MLTVSLRAEFKDKIQFISLHPGKMKTEIAQTDADIEPKKVAKMIFESYENDEFKNKNGIMELNNGLIEW